MSKQITVPLFVFWEKCRFSGAAEYDVLPYDLRNLPSESQRGRAFVTETSATFEVPDNFNPVPAQVAALEAEKQAARAAFQKRVTELDAQIQSLLAIEYVAEAV